MNKIEYNWQRKIWHAGGSIYMVLLFWRWNDYWVLGPGESKWDLGPLEINVIFHRLEFNGALVMTVFAWLVAGGITLIDLVRCYLPRQANAVKNFPLFGSWMRRHEEKSFNSATYFIWGAAILITAYWLGFGQSGFLISAILVTGLGDVLAATLRHKLAGHKKLDPRTCGLIGFVLLSWLIIFFIGRIGWLPALIISLITATVEAKTPDWYNRLCRRCRPRPEFVQKLGILSRLYPDDNLVIPLLVYFLAMLLAPH